MKWLGLAFTCSGCMIIGFCDPGLVVAVTLITVGWALICREVEREQG